MAIDRGQPAQPFGLKCLPRFDFHVGLGAAFFEQQVDLVADVVAPEIKRLAVAVNGSPLERFADDGGFEQGAAGLGACRALGVRREKAALSSGCKPHPATAPAGSNRSNYGGNEMVGAFG